MLPKQYQSEALAALREYMRLCNEQKDPELPFIQCSKKFMGTAFPYKSLDGMEHVPFVCLRFPTGGGKTFVAAYSVGVIHEEFAKTDELMVLWLVPTTPILEQTIRSLKNPLSSYNAVLKSSLKSPRILTVAEALELNPEALAGQTTIIVATLQTFRVSDKAGRKVYEPNGALGPYFKHLEAGLAKDLRRDEHGVVQASLANVLRLHHPIVVVDEAHNAKTDLSFDVLRDLSPSAIVEFTATPDAAKSNILYSASAAQLKAENMLKIPILLEVNQDWRLVLQDALGLHSHLRVHAQKEEATTTEYIRPILLLQAEPKGEGKDRMDVDRVVEELVTTHGIPRGKIAISTGDKDELEGVDLNDRKCAIEFVVTQSKLREGWDCPFAYALCSFQELSSATAVEQLLGRIIRLPMATRKQTEELNKAYAFVKSHKFAEAATALQDALVKAGFEKLDAKKLIQSFTPTAVTPPAGQSTLFQPFAPIKVKEAGAAQVPAEVAGKVEVSSVDGTIVVKAPVTKADVEALGKAFPSAAAALAKLPTVDPEPQAKVVKPAIQLPLLAIKTSNDLEPFEESHLIDAGWDITKDSHTLSEGMFAKTVVSGQTAVIDVAESSQVQWKVQALQTDLIILSDQQNWSIAKLAQWLSATIVHPDVTPEKFTAFAKQVLIGLERDRGFHINELVHHRFRLKDSLQALVAAHRYAHRKKGFQTLLVGKGPAKLTVDNNLQHVFGAEHTYAYTRVYSGGHQFNNHYYDVIGNLNASGEEFECAQFLDKMPQMDTWVRNVERQQNSFFLQTPDGKFYPDFVCRLKDGRILVVEYKGEHLVTADEAKMKQTVGEFWASQTNGKCIFVMVSNREWNQIQAAVGAVSVASTKTSGHMEK